MSDGLESGSTNILSDRDESLQTVATAADPVSREREGLPREFRMRADRHYVDQLSSRASGQPVRLVPIDEIDSPASFRESDITVLIQSIRTHGILQPLLVRRLASRYAVIAGRRRLAAARVLRIAEVPCLLHQADDDEAAALAMAENVTARGGQAPIGGAIVAEVRHAMARHLATVQTATTLLSSGAPPLGRSAVDVVRAHAWRAARLLDVIDVATGAPNRSATERPLWTIVDQVVDGFRAESRLSNFQLAVDVHDGAASLRWNEHDVMVGLSSAVLATLPLIEQGERATLTIDVSAGASIVLAVKQSPIEVPGALARRFFDEASGDRPGGWCAVAAALAVRTVAERHGGRAQFDAAPAGGSSLTIVLPRRS